MLIVFHGSNRKNLFILREGTWVTENKSTAQSFGSYVYEILVDEEDVCWEYLSAETCDWDTKGNGEWRGQLRKDRKILINQPFMSTNKRYTPERANRLFTHYMYLLMRQEDCIRRRGKGRFGIAVHNDEWAIEWRSKTMTMEIIKAWFEQRPALWRYAEYLPFEERIQREKINGTL